MRAATVAGRLKPSLGPALAEDWRNGGFGLYLHWPFCQAKCPYCDFNSHVMADVDHRRWANALTAEIRRIGAQTKDRILHSVFFGGGTPSLMPPDLVFALLETIRATWPLRNDLEVTLEANPTSAEAGRFRGYRDAGVNRVSIGLQALDDGHLKQLGRLHSAAEGIKTYEMARSIFARVSFDLIYARQHQSLPEWQAELERALAMGPDHLSLYQLTIEPGTAFGTRHARGTLRGLPDEDLSADMYEATQEACGGAGLPAYEVSNHAREGAESAHNLIYWRYGDYAGVGPGAHGRLTLGAERLATQALSAPMAWLAAVEQRGTGEMARTPVAGPEQAQEYLMMSLRLSEGSDLGRFAALNGAPLSPVALQPLLDDGLLWQSGVRIGATATGRPVLNAVLRALL
jgi:putative oxygen-independent coproporphyrinogen III oxidase